MKVRISSVTSTFAAVFLLNLTFGGGISWGINRIAEVSAGSFHTCALTTAGGSKCWGQNSYGQLGDTTLLDRLTPVNVAGLASGVTQISAGRYHTCAILTGGLVKCWGRNDYGQLGDNTTISNPGPVDLSGPFSDVTQIASGSWHTCALTTVGGVKCWGAGTSGQLGDGAVINSAAPVGVFGLSSGVAQVAAGFTHSCALMSAGGVKCWGGLISYNFTPIDVPELLNGVTQIASGASHVCALTIGGGVKCWGWNNAGQLGDGSVTNSISPVDVYGLSSGVVKIAAGGGHTCALTAGGEVLCWGANDKGQLGYNSNDLYHLTPVRVAGLVGTPANITLGWQHSCSLMTAGGVQCWGSNAYGQLGANSYSQRLNPVRVLDHYSLSGTVTSNGTPLSAVTVDGGYLGTFDTGADGKFLFPSVLETDSYILSVHKEGHCFNRSLVVSQIIDDTTVNFFEISCHPNPTPTPSAHPDSTPPLAVARKAAVKAGKKGRLSYQVIDKAGMSTEVIVVKLGKIIKKRFKVAMSAIPADGNRSVSFSAKGLTKGVYYYYVTATDAAGNVGATSRAKLTVK